MLGFRLFYYALLRWLRDFFPMVGVSVLPVLGFYALVGLYDAYAPNARPDEFVFYISIGLFIILSAIIISWGAVSWQRVSILRERTSLAPRFKNRVFLNYAWRLGAILMIIGVVTACYGWVSSLVLSKVILQTRDDLLLGLLGFGLALFVWFGSSFLLLRFGVSLGGTATDNPMTMHQSWTMTRGHGLAIFLISFSLLLVQVALTVLLAIFDPRAAWPWLVLVWIMITLWIANLTELYSYLRAQNDVTEIFG